MKRLIDSKLVRKVKPFLTHNNYEEDTNTTMIGGALEVSGSTTFDSEVIFDGSTTFNYAVQLEENLNVEQFAIFQNDVVFYGCVVRQGPLTNTYKPEEIKLKHGSLSAPLGYTPSGLGETFLYCELFISGGDIDEGTFGGLKGIVNFVNNEGKPIELQTIRNLSNATGVSSGSFELLMDNVTFSLNEWPEMLTYQVGRVQIGATMYDCFVKTASDGYLAVYIINPNDESITWNEGDVLTLYF